LAVLPVLVCLSGTTLELSANADCISMAQQAVASRKLPARKGSPNKNISTIGTLMKHKRARLFLPSQALIAPTIILLIYR
jgi:hypothetical protein